MSQARTHVERRNAASVSVAEERPHQSADSTASPRSDASCSFVPLAAIGRRARSNRIGGVVFRHHSGLLDRADPADVLVTTGSRRYYVQLVE